jgi:signal transduction histidine kinase
MDAPVNILLVDDDPRNLDALEAILGAQGYHLIRAIDAERALRALLEHDVAAIILDIRMPNVDGIELAKTIKGTRRYRQIPILFLTAYQAADEEIVTGYGAGAVDYLTKPVSPQVLQHKVAVFAELFRKTRALAELNDQLEERVRARTGELERSETALRASARQKDEFIAVLAHELRNPLVPLRTGVDILLQALQAPSPLVERTLTAMNRQVDHIVRLIDDLLDVSRISRGELELKKQRMDLGAIVQGAVETFLAIFDQKHVTVTVDAPRRIHGVVDSTRVAQIIGNLLHNASKFTSERGTVAVTLSYENGRACVRVTDDGIGIPRDQLERVFEMFTHIERRVPAGNRGAGIGLALARRLAQMHDGDLVASSPGEGLGTTFTLTLPATLVVEISDRIEVPRAGVPKPCGDPLRVLVIEDNEDVADTIAAWLAELGHDVGVARTGRAGYEQVLLRRPDLVLCDLGLPEMDGVELCRRVRQEARGFRPIMVALTGWGKEEDRRRTTEAGFDRHLVKPVKLDTLAELLEVAGAARTRSASS